MISEAELKEMEPKIQEIAKDACASTGITDPNIQRKIEDAMRALLKGTPLYKALGIPEKTINQYYALGERLFKTGKYSEALVFFQALQLKDAKNPLYPFCIAACYHHMKDYEMASGYYFATLLLKPSDPMPCHHMYDCFLKLNDLPSAIGALEMVIERSKDHPEYALLYSQAQMNLTGIKKILEKKINPLA